MQEKIERPRILHVVPDLGVGGAEAVLTRLVTFSDRHKEENVVVTLVPGGHYVGILRDAGVTVIELDCRHSVSAISTVVRLARAIRELKPQAIHGWLYYGNIFALAALVLSGRRQRTVLVWNLRCSHMEFFLYRRRLQIAERLCRAFSSFPDILLANSFAGREAHAAIGYPRQKIRVFLNGVDENIFKPDPIARREVRAELALGVDDLVVIHPARLDAMKDHGNFIRAMEKLPHVKAIMVGSGTATLQALLPDNVRALDVRLDLARLYAASDIVVSSSAFGEGTSNALIEGMACGLPAVATRVGDAARIVGETGILVDPQDPAALASAIDHLTKSVRSNGRSPGEQARQRIQKMYSLEAAVGELGRIYEETPL